MVAATAKRQTTLQARRKYRRAKRKASRCLYAGAFGVVLVMCLLGFLGGHFDNTESASHGRRLSGAGKCDLTANGPFLTRGSDDGTEMSPGMGALYLLITLYFFIGIAIVCDYFFEPSLGEISDALHLSPNVAGATFMAAGSSAPELFTSVGDTFATSNNIGIGTIVGSAMFNILIIVALSAMAAGEELAIDWRPISRDVAFYTISVFCLLFFFAVWNGEGIDTVKTFKGGGENPNYGTVQEQQSVNGVEGLIMVLVYVLYIVFMMFNDQIFAKCQGSKTTPAASGGVNKDAAGFEERGEAKAIVSSEMAEIEKGANTQTPTSEPSGPAEAEDSHKIHNAFAHGLDMHVTGDGGHGEDDEDGLFDWPDTPMDRFFFILSVPFKIAFVLTIPDCNKEKWRYLYPITFLMCIVWLGVCCMSMAMLGTAIGCLWGIDPFLMGIMVLAVGTSVPDAMASMIVAKAGEGDMAIANAIGSNVFDILLGLGLPWFVYGYSKFCAKDPFCAKGEKPTHASLPTFWVELEEKVPTCNKHTTETACNANTLANATIGCHWFKGNNGTFDDCVILKNADSNMEIDVVILFGTIIFFVGTLAAYKWKMGRAVAMRLLGLYVAYIVFQLVFKAVNDSK